MKISHFGPITGLAKTTERTFKIFNLHSLGKGVAPKPFGKNPYIISISDLTRAFSKSV